jgi:glycosyltransferase involved in cell wall biosynthesis
VHSWDYKSLDVEVLGSRLAGVKYLFTKKNAAWSKRWFLKSLLASHIAYDNPFMKKNFFSHKLLKNKTTFIPHGVNTDLFFPMESAKEEGSNFNICCVGNINNNKNQGFIVDALKDLPAKIHLNLYGKVDPSYIKKLDIKITNSGLKDRIHFKGFVENKNLPKVLNEHDIFILASVREGLPVSILEALACGLPVLSSDSGGGARYIFKDSVSDSVFKLSNPKNFKALILKLYDNKDYYKLKSKESLSIVIERFQLEREVKQYEQLYDEI